MKMMQRFVKKMILLVVMMGAVSMLEIAGGYPANADAKTVTKKVTMDVHGKKMVYRRLAILYRAKRVTVKSSRKSVVTVKYYKNRKDRRIAIRCRKKGRATFTVKCILKNGKKKTIRYRVKVTAKKRQTALEKAKQAFQIQNRYRKEAGVSELEWSDELYQFCLYRLKTSGFDSHKNLLKDTADYFGNFAEAKTLSFGENLYIGSPLPKDAMAAWKKSTGHYRNLLKNDYVCGAIAVYKNMWCAVFWDTNSSFFDGWRDCKLQQVTVKRYDTISGQYQSGCRIAYYEQGCKSETLKNVAVSDVSGKNVYLETGKTYVFYESVRPDGCEKAKSVTVTVTDDIKEIILVNN